MSRSIEGVSRQEQRNAPETTGHAYIAIPQGTNREAFIETCYRRNRVTIITDYGTVVNECYILTSTLQEIEFPLDSGSKGSCVCYVSGSFTNKPIVIGVLYENDDSSLLNEQMFRVRKKMNGTEILLQGDAGNNSLIVNVTSSNPSTVQIAVKGNEESKLSIDSSCAVDVKADKSVNIISFGEITSQIKDVEEQEAVYKSTINKDGLIYSRKNEKGDIELDINNDGISLTRVTEKNDISILINDDGFDLKTEKGDKEFKFDKQNLIAKINGGEESVTFGQNKITIVTGKDLVINNGSDSAVLFQKLVTCIDQIQTQMGLLKEAFNVGANAVPVPPPTEGGVAKTSFAAAYAAVAGIVKVDFSPAKSQVVTLD